MLSIVDSKDMILSCYFISWKLKVHVLNHRCHMLLTFVSSFMIFLLIFSNVRKLETVVDVNSQTLPVSYSFQTKLLGQMLYYVLTTGSGQQTLGEEYCDIIQVIVFFLCHSLTGFSSKLRTVAWPLLDDLAVEVKNVG